MLGVQAARNDFAVDLDRDAALRQVLGLEQGRQGGLVGQRQGLPVEDDVHVRIVAACRGRCTRMRRRTLSASRVRGNMRHHPPPYVAGGPIPQENSMALLSRPLRHTLAAALALAAAPVFAQGDSPYSNTVFFGDSLTESGYFRPVLIQVVGPSGALIGKFTTNPGLVWSEYLAQYYGADASPNGNGQRSEERREGDEGVSTVRCRGSAAHSKKKRKE